jgi:hypothetical protein
MYQLARTLAQNAGYFRGAGAGGEVSESAEGAQRQEIPGAPAPHRCCQHWRGGVFSADSAHMRQRSSANETTCFDVIAANRCDRAVLQRSAPI